MLSAPVCHWCGTWKGDKLCSSCKKARYCSEKHQTLHWRSGHKSDCLQLISSSEASSSIFPAVGKVPASKSWPEYEIAIDYEGAFNSDSCDESNSKSLVMQRPGKPDDMMQSWMDQFEVLTLHPLSLSFLFFFLICSCLFLLTTIIFVG
jgi:pre-rRNA-processing protein TSR4